jgi:EPS-associated MarR family transcriptional regulator
MRSTPEHINPSMAPQDLPYYLLCQLTHEPAASQRGLAERFGVSLGKVNYCLRALVDKGLVKANNFRRSDNKLAYSYMLTPAGFDEKGRLAKAFLKRKLVEFELLQQEIETLRQEASKHV